MHPQVPLEPRLTAELFVAFRTGINHILVIISLDLNHLPLLVFPPPTGDRSFIFRFALAFRAGIRLERVSIVGVVFLFACNLSIIFSQFLIREVQLFNLEGINVRFALQIHGISLVRLNLRFNNRQLVMNLQANCPEPVVLQQLQVATLAYPLPVRIFLERQLNRR